MRDGGRGVWVCVCVCVLLGNAEEIYSFQNQICIQTVMRKCLLLCPVYICTMFIIMFKNPHCSSTCRIIYWLTKICLNTTTLTITVLVTIDIGTMCFHHKKTSNLPHNTVINVNGDGIVWNLSTIGDWQSLATSIKSRASNSNVHKLFTATTNRYTTVHVSKRNVDKQHTSRDSSARVQ